MRLEISRLTQVCCVKTNQWSSEWRNQSVNNEEIWPCLYSCSCTDQKLLKCNSLTLERLGRKVCLEQMLRVAWIQLLRMEARLEFPWRVGVQCWPGFMVNVLPKHFARLSWLISRRTLLSVFPNSLYGLTGTQNSQRSERGRVAKWSKSVGFLCSASPREAHGSLRTIYSILWVPWYSSTPAALC